MAEKFVEPQTVAEFQEMLFHIYGKADERYSDQELIWRMIEEILSTGEVARKNIRDIRIFEMFSTQVARTCAWWFAVTSRFSWDVQEMLWNKYPGICSYCLHAQNCICGIEHPGIPAEIKKEALRKARRERAREPQTFAEHQLLHSKLYLAQNLQKDSTQIALHMCEEAGEVSRASRKKNQEERIGKLYDEMPDILSWMFALMNVHKLDLAKSVWALYPYECERCHKTVCECVHHED